MLPIIFIVKLFFFEITTSFPLEGRVVNGTDAIKGNYPFAVSLRGIDGRHFCGASVIRPNWILTAAHCVVGEKPYDIFIQFGSIDIAPNGGNVAVVKEIIIHENYQPSKNYANDIALLKLEGKLLYNHKTIGPVQLPRHGFEVPQLNAKATLVGWGLNETSGSIQTHLQQVDLKVYSDEECNQRHNGRTTPDQICGGVDAGGKGQCSGDSGGPLLYEKSIQIGIVSWSIKPCTIAPYPGVYTKVSHYIDWIDPLID